MMTKNIIILDDHPIFHKGLKLIIDPEPLLKVLDMCRTSEELFFSLSLGHADILLLDCSLPEGENNIPELVAQLYRQSTNTAVILMGDNVSHQKIAEQCSSMIAGYLCKTLTADSILILLHRVRRMLNSKSNNIHQQKKTINNNIPFASNRLSVKEKTVMKYLQMGLNVTQIAERLNRSVKTISSQKMTAMRKLDLESNRDIFELKLDEM
ncbi:response regulator transcription factor [Enterobacter roggenkampii]|nr:response regulator transcription factor [Enterobacter roggenkampii]MCB7499521.1 response regulator transcription factor [Enterobacter roggenkampii]MCE5965752.1 response regulator transcription factor [Enterobacter roggenkampii]MCE5970184.1 response regulator transcription factor [Enterobacter roggenkampii]UHY21903.1 response regulator transcription factor [Enterobacter roggenkampii]